MGTSIGILALCIIALATLVVRSANAQPSWKVAYFFIIDAGHSGNTDDYIKVRLKARYGVDFAEADKLIVLAKDGKAEAFEILFEKKLN